MSNAEAFQHAEAESAAYREQIAIAADLWARGCDTAEIAAALCVPEHWVATESNMFRIRLEARELRG